MSELEPLTITIPRLMSPSQAAQALRCSASNVKRLIRDGELIAINVAPAGSKIPRWVLEASEVKELIDARRTKPDVTATTASFEVADSLVDAADSSACAQTSSTRRSQVAREVKA